jgi:nucleotide-binding universal stress UspA family protein
MKNYRLVIGINFSECAFNAAKYVLTVLKPFHGEARLVFCLSDFVAVTDLAEELGDLASEAQGQSMSQLYHKKLAEKQVELNKIKGPGFSIETVVRHGYPEDELQKEVAEFGADLLVVGLSGNVGTLAELLGSKTSDIIKKASVPVLSVPLAAPYKNAELAKVMYITDFRKAEFSSLHQLIGFLPSASTQVHCLHYCHVKPDEWDDKRLAQLQEYCDQTYRNQKVICEMLVGENLVGDISTFVNNKGIQLIAMTHKHRRLITQWLHPDVAQKLLLHANVPFMLFCD